MAKTLRTEELILNMGPQHPSTHGVLRLIVTLDGENIVGALPDIGYLHSSVEKMMEHRNYTQNIALADRGMDYLAALVNEMAVLRAVETLADVPVPDRARYIRTIFMELQRLASHLLWLGTYGIDLGAVTAFLWCMREREIIMDLFESVTGGRLHHVYFRLGGVNEDLPTGWTDRCREFCHYFVNRIDEYHKLLTGNPIWQIRTQGIGGISREQAIAFGACGPVARASGLHWDVRKSHPYEMYDRVEFQVPVYTEGDCYARYLVRVDEMREATRIVLQCLDQLPDGDFRAPRVSLNLKAPPGEVYTRVESPRGDLGVHLVSVGGEFPWRVKIRAPSFVNLHALTEMMRGWKIADIISILGSIDIVLADVDR
jgi:NAD(P)H-quinone oxidoreductase subunit H